MLGLPDPPGFGAIEGGSATGIKIEQTMHCLIVLPRTSQKRHAFFHHVFECLCLVWVQHEYEEAFISQGDKHKEFLGPDRVAYM